MEPNRQELHEVHHALGHIDRVVAVRLRPGQDLVGALLSVCEAHHIRAGVIPVMLGTLERLAYRSVAVDQDAKSGIGYSPRRLLEGPVEVVGGQGVVSELEDGTLFIHLHLTVADLDMKIHGGHVEPGDAVVRSTIDTMILECAGLRLRRALDPSLDLMVMRPTAGPG